MKIYTRSTTKEFLTNPNSKAVYLYGSNMGYSNFGDILQLKNEIWYHQKMGKFTPIVFLRLNAPYGYGHEPQNLEWFNVEHICYIADDNIKKPKGLQEIKPGSVTPHLFHVYGGGFLNSFWGKEMLNEILTIKNHLKVEKYFFSGQQISKEMAQHLSKELNGREPFVFGVRDKESLEYMQAFAPNINVRFSFDDITEIMNEWVTKQKSGVKSRLKSRVSPTALWHFNTTKYVAASNDVLAMRIHKLKKLHDYNAVLLQSYNDGSGETKDTLQTVVNMENSFPYTSYRVLNLAQLALDINPLRDAFPDIINTIGGAKIAVASSYHTAMLCVLLGIPSYLMVENEYYQQKQKALGLEVSFDRFIEEPVLRNEMIYSQMNERLDWLTHINNLLVDI